MIRWVQLVCHKFRLNKGKRKNIIVQIMRENTGIIRPFISYKLG